MRSAAHPDFEQLGRTTPWPASEWSEAWGLLDHPRVWPTLLSLVDSYSGSPTDVAERLVSAMTEPVKPLQVSGFLVPRRTAEERFEDWLWEETFWDGVPADRMDDYRALLAGTLAGRLELLRLHVEDLRHELRRRASRILDWLRR